MLAEVDAVLANLSQGAEPRVSKRFNTDTPREKKKKKAEYHFPLGQGKGREGIKEEGKNT